MVRYRLPATSIIIRQNLHTKGFIEQTESDDCLSPSLAKTGTSPCENGTSNYHVGEQRMLQTWFQFQPVLRKKKKLETETEKRKKFRDPYLVSVSASLQT